MSHSIVAPEVSKIIVLTTGKANPLLEVSKEAIESHFNIRTETTVKISPEKRKEKHNF